jgi:hypothetical protein
MMTDAEQFQASSPTGTDRPNYWDVALSQIHDLTMRPSHRPRRFWLRIRNRFIPWFMWSY